LKLNPEQQAAIRYTDGPLLVLAGAGSGKTRVITQKIAYLIDACGYSPASIIAVTFTNKSAKEMQQRVAARLGKEQLKGLNISTFHRLGLQIIRQEHKAVGLKKGFSIYDGQDSVALVRELMRKEFGDYHDHAEKVSWQISQWKSQFITASDALQQTDNLPEQVIAARVYEEYTHHLRTYNAVDFDDLIMIPVLLLRDHDEVREKWQQKIRYVLVDEYQDTNITQYELIKLLVGKQANLTVVGDDDQSIYTWRGANPENLMLLQQDYPALKVIKLEQNYRSTGGILKAANALIANNPHLFEKKLWSAMGHGDPIKIMPANNEDKEAESVAHRLLHHKFSNNTQFNDYAILYRGNHQSRLFEKALREYNIPYDVSGGTSFFAYTEIKDIMAYFRLLTNSDDDNAFLRIANTPRREIGPGTLEKLANFAAQQGGSLFDACFSHNLPGVMSSRATNRLQTFAEMIARAGAEINASPTAKTLKHFIDDIHYRDWLDNICPDEMTAERKMENVTDLLSWLDKMYKNSQETLTLSDMVNRLTLLDRLDRDDESTANTVQLATLHAAKGLEFPHVFLVGFEENLLPHRTSIEEEGIHEERRLAYVGITRAQRTLNISFARKRKRYGEIQECDPSRFLDELPADLLHWPNEDSSTEEKKETAKTTLTALRDMLQEKT